MKFHQNFNKLAIRPYSQGYQAPSTASFNTDLSTFQITSSQETIELLETIQMPDFIEVLINFMAVPFVDQDNLIASYQLEESIWPSVPLYPQDQPQFIMGLKLVYGGRIKIRDGMERDSVLIRGNIIEGFEIDVREEEPVYTHTFDYHKNSISVKDKKNQETLPVWPVGGFYRPGCQLEDIQQVFSCVGQSDGKTSLRKTFLVQWNDQGFYPPLSQKKEDRMTVFQTNRQNPYIKFIHEIQKGVITLKLRNLRISEESACFTYKSIDMKPDVIGKAFIHFMRD